MTKTDLESMYIKKDGIVFTPRYTFSNYNPETEEYEGLEITATAEEVYQEWLNRKQIDICAPKTNQELQEEIENLKAQLETVHERLCTQQEMSSTVIAHVFGNEVLKNE